MHITEEEKEAISWFLSNHWHAFFNCSKDFMSVVALHKLAEKFNLADADKPELAE